MRAVISPGVQQLSYFRRAVLNADSMNEDEVNYLTSSSEDRKLQIKLKESVMHYMKIKRIIALVILLTVGGIGIASSPAARAGENNNREPELPTPLCDKVQAPAGNSVSFHAYAVGVQRYRWNGTSWSFVEPVASLYADADFHGKVGDHYVGPTWESNSGSNVVAARVDGCTPDATAIPWLLLETVSNAGSGVFNSVTYIQRVNTVGGVAPAAPGSTIGAVIDVPYTAEYYFYRASN